MRERPTLITGRQAHNNNVLRELVVFVGANQLHDLIIDDASIWVIDCAMTANQQLGMFFVTKIRRLLFEEVAEFDVRINDIRDTWAMVDEIQQLSTKEVTNPSKDRNVPLGRYSHVEAT